MKRSNIPSTVAKKNLPTMSGVYIVEEHEKIEFNNVFIEPEDLIGKTNLSIPEI